MITNDLNQEKIGIYQLLCEILDKMEGLQFLNLLDHEISIEFRKRWETKIDEIMVDIKNYIRNEFPIVVLGRWNSGKSTLINAILGEELLPSANKEMTSILTKVCYARKKHAVIHYKKGDSKIIQIKEIEKYISFRGSKYSDNIKQIDIGFNSSLFQSGLYILDTPGLNSINELNNDISFNVIPRVHTIILTFSGLDVGGQDNLDLIERVFRLNYNNLYNIVFVITKKDILNKKQIKEAQESLKELIRIAQNRVRTVKQCDINICMVSSYLELKYQQYQKHIISENELLSDLNLGLSNVDHLELIHQKSNFDNFYEILNKSILSSQNKKNRTYRLYIMIQGILTELLEDYNNTYNKIVRYENSSIEQFSDLLQHKVTVERIINKDCKEKLAKFRNRLCALEFNDDYAKQHINEVINNTYKELHDYIDETPYEVIFKDEFKELNQQISIISTKMSIDWMKNIKDEFDSEWNEIIADIALILEKKHKEIYDEFGENDVKEIKIVLNNKQIKINAAITNIVISVTSSVSVGAGLFTIGNGLLPGIGGIVGTIAGALIGYAAIKFHTPEEKKEDLKKTLYKYLFKNQKIYIDALKELYLQYEDKISQLENYLNDSLEKAIQDKKTFLDNHYNARIKDEEVKKQLTVDMETIKTLIPKVNFAFSPYIKAWSNNS